MASRLEREKKSNNKNRTPRRACREETGRSLTQSESLHHNRINRMLWLKNKQANQRALGGLCACAQQYQAARTDWEAKTLAFETVTYRKIITENNKITVTKCLLSVRISFFATTLYFFYLCDFYSDLFFCFLPPKIDVHSVDSRDWIFIFIFFLLYDTLDEVCLATQWRFPIMLQV